jgi:hypothetical protein
VFPEIVIARIDPSLPLRRALEMGPPTMCSLSFAGAASARNREAAKGGPPSGCPRARGGQEGEPQPRVNARYKVNTYSIEAVDVFFSSGIFCMMLSGWRAPTSTAMYCLPFTA